MYFAAVIATAFAAVYIKQVRPDFALLVSLSGVLLIFTGIVPRLSVLINDVRTFTQIGGMGQSYVYPVLKIIGITYIVQFASDICLDAGEKALSAHIETLGKITVAFIALPIVEDVFSLIIGLME